MYTEEEEVAAGNHRSYEGQEEEDGEMMHAEDGNEGGEGDNGEPESSMLDYVEDEEEEEGEEDDEEEEEFQKIRREHVFAEIDFTKRKSKIICTLG